MEQINYYCTICEHKIKTDQTFGLSVIDMFNRDTDRLAAKWASDSESDSDSVSDSDSHTESDIDTDLI